MAVNPYIEPVSKSRNEGIHKIHVLLNSCHVNGGNNVIYYGSVF